MRHREIIFILCIFVVWDCSLKVIEHHKAKCTVEFRASIVSGRNPISHTSSHIKWYTYMHPGCWWFLCAVHDVFWGYAFGHFNRAPSLSPSLFFSFSVSVPPFLCFSPSLHRATALRRKLELCPAPMTFTHAALSQPCTQTSLHAVYKHCKKKHPILRSLPVSCNMMRK